jgi:hypothetical protein
VSWVFVHASWHDVPIEDIGAVLLVGTTQVVWQLAADALHVIMHVVTAEVTVEVSGVIGVWPTCANAALPMPSIIENPDENKRAAATANVIAMRRIIVSQAAFHAVCKERRTPS